MRSFASEVSQLVHSFGAMEDLAEKIASVDDSQKAQLSVAEGSSALYDVIRKEAEGRVNSDIPGHLKMAACANAMSRALGRGALSSDTNLKIAAVAAVDEALTTLMREESLRAKYAEMRAYGREYMMEILRGVI